MESTQNLWSPFPNPNDTSQFCRLVFDELEKRQLAVTGDPPALTLSSGKTLYLDNIALRCTSEPRAEWAVLVGEFLDTIEYLNEIEDPTAQSPEVARASLRLRLAVNPPIEVSGDGLRHDPFGVVSRPAMPGTVWLLYLQIPGAAVGVTPEHLADWGIGVDEAFELARLHAADQPPRRVRRKGRVHLLDSASMFTHTAVLNPEALIPVAPDGWFVSAPSREQVLAVRAAATKGGFDGLIELVQASAEVSRMSGYPLSLSPWFVPPEGIGSFGEEAELVQLCFDRFDGTFQRVRMGPRVHELFACLEAASLAGRTMATAKVSSQRRRHRGRVS